MGEAEIVKCGVVAVPAPRPARSFRFFPFSLPCAMMEMIVNVAAELSRDVTQVSQNDVISLPPFSLPVGKGKFNEPVNVVTMLVRSISYAAK